jgi:hypothetical protein
VFQRLFAPRPDTPGKLQSLMRSRPWEEGAPVEASEALKLHGLLGWRECVLYFHLARDVLSGRGTLVDAGSFLGKSASLLAAGLRANAAACKSKPKIHCFDNFLVNECQTADLINSLYGREIRVGDSILDLFEDQVRPIRTMLEVHAGDFLTAIWPSTPIELLLVDIAKSRKLWARVVTEMFPCLTPGVSLVVHQDYHHPWLPHIHITMEQLHNHFELVIPRVDSSAVFLCTSPITEAEISRTLAAQPDLAEQLAIFGRCVERVPFDERIALDMARIVLRGLLNEDVDRLGHDIEARSLTATGIDRNLMREFQWIKQLFMTPGSPARGAGLDYLSTLGR